jgi:phosphonate metabolism protein PhnN/1,5-bisphosphokinase (PRPP-forming)
MRAISTVSGLHVAPGPRAPRLQPRRLEISTGVLVLLVGPEARGKDMLIATARNRYAANLRMEFPARVVTRPSHLDQEHISISRRAFRDIENNCGFAVAWEHFGTRHGLTAGALQALDDGCIVVIATAAEAVDDFEALGHRIEIVTLHSAVDIARPFSGRRRPPVESACLQGHVVRHQITHSGDIAHAVRSFHAVLDTVQATAATRQSRGRSSSVGDNP